MRSLSLPLRIAVLECDTPLPTTKATYGGYGGVFESLLHRGAASLSNPHVQPSDLTITKFHVEGDSDGNTPYPSLDSVDVILLTGSKHDSFADSPWILRLVEFTKRALADKRVKVIGVCFGHQIVGRALGCGVGRNEEGWEAAVCGVDLNEKGKEIFGMEEMVSFHFPSISVVIFGFRNTPRLQWLSLYFHLKRRWQWSYSAVKERKVGQKRLWHFLSYLIS